MDHSGSASSTHSVFAPQSTSFNYSINQSSSNHSAQAISTVSTKAIGLVLLGVGRWGSHLLRHFLNHPQVRVLAVVDPISERLANLSQRFSLDREVLLTTDWSDALALPGVEAVVVATPAVTHYGIIQAALQKGLHVLAEKPLTLDPAESLELCRLAIACQRQLVIDHTYLFHPAIQLGKAVIQQGKLGNHRRYGYAARTHLGPVRQDVDALWDLAIHDIAIFNHWLNETPIAVQAQGQVWLQPHSVNSQLFPQGLSDLVWVQLTYPSGFTASIHLCWSNPDKQRRLCLVGDRATLVFDELNTAAPLTLRHGHLDSTESCFTPIDQQDQVLEVAAIEPLGQVCQHFIECVQTNQPSPISSGWLGADLVKILAALTRSVNRGGQVVQVMDEERGDEERGDKERGDKERGDKEMRRQGDEEREEGR